MPEISKRDGRSEDFIYEKIVTSAVKSGASIDVVRNIAKQIEGSIKEGASTKEIKQMVLEALGKENPDWENNWLTYDRAVKKREE
jgi:transcriptional regulator NrdR family protein